jgi:serine/threonine-protein kinase
MEAKLLKSLHHLGIPKLYYQYETEDSVFLVEEYKEGETLYSICQSEQLSYQSILSFGIQLCDILQYLHSQPHPILHLDLNPNNIIVYQERLALIDFSAAICLESKKYYGQRYGTPGYAAPEQFNKKALNCRTDIFAFGKTLAFMLDKIEKVAIAQKTYLRLEKIIRTCIRQYKSQRFHSIQQVGSLLSELYQEVKSNGTKKELDYVIAGTQSRIGTTHLALLLSAYLRLVYGSCLYMEKNETRNAALLLREKGKLGKAGIYEYEQIPIRLVADKEHGDRRLSHEFACTVSDYGVLDQNNLNEFLKYSNRILVYGTKAYELPFTRNCLELLPSFAETKYFGNFSSQKEFEEIQMLFQSKHNYCLPYEPSFIIKKESEVFMLFAKMERGAKNET